MRKLLALILILGMATAANAAFELSINGEPAPDEIVLQPSDWIELDVHVLPDIAFNGGNLEIVLSNNQGRLDYANVVFYPSTATYWTFGSEFIQDDAGFSYQAVDSLSSPLNFVMTGGSITQNAINNSVEYDNPFGQGLCPANSFPVLMDGLMFHCEEPTDVIIELVAAGEGISVLEMDSGGEVIAQPTIIPAGTVIDSIYVIQPEPATMCLLGLGGLALLRRRR